MPQPFLLLIAANLALAGFLGWKLSLWPVRAWLAVQRSMIAANLAQAGFLGWKLSLWPVRAWLVLQRSKAVFFLTLYDSINDMNYFRYCLHHTSSVPQPFLLLISANLAQAGFLDWKLSLWSVPPGLEVQQSKFVFLLTLYDIINDMKYLRTVAITPQPRHSHFCCWLLPNLP